MLLEICANSVESAIAAEKGGADRIELCDNMYEGGTTPSLGMFLTCKQLLSIPVYPIIRPRGGDFHYTDIEFQTMKTDIGLFKDHGCEGVVFGVLRNDAKVDVNRCRALIELCGSMDITFHRAFDRCVDLVEALEDIIKLGIKRVLTSGGEDSVERSLRVLEALVHQANGRISIMPGSGVKEDNILSLVKHCGAREYHSTAKKLYRSSMQVFTKRTIDQCDKNDIITVSDPVRVKALKQLLTKGKGV